MKNIIISFLFGGFLVSGSAIWAETHPTCPEKVLDQGTVEGIFMGTECGDSCYALIKLDNGEEFYFMADEDEAEKSFGKTGNRVSVTYELIQYWNEFGDMCSRNEVFKEGRIITGN